MGMVKLGTFPAEGLRPRPRGWRGYLPGLLNRRMSFQLLRDPIVSANDSQLFNDLMHLIRLSNGINRTTFRNRFADLDKSVSTVLANRFNASTPLDVHDWAASDCITSVEWAETLLTAFPNASLTASDVALYLLEVLCPDGEVFIAERGGEPLQYILGSFVVRLHPPEPKLLALNYLLGKSGLRKFAQIRERIRPAAEHLDDGETSVELPPYRVNKISLIHPKAVSLQKDNPRFRVQRHSIFDSLPKPVDVVRSMNIFNPAHFTEKQLMQGVKAVAESLKPGGIWIVGRTGSPGEVKSAVSILENTPSGFRLLQHFGNASDIEEIALRSLVP